jgi:hypothetical protein
MCDAFILMPKAGIFWPKRQQKSLPAGRQVRWRFLRSQENLLLPSLAK